MRNTGIGTHFRLGLMDDIEFNDLLRILLPGYVPPVEDYEFVESTSVLQAADEIFN